MTEQQPYELLRRYPDFEVRRYPAHTLAEVKVSGSFDRASNAAFRHLFGYISGNNAARQSIAMTAPVVQRDVQSSSASRGGDNEYLVAFVLPEGMTESTAPAPAERGVTIRAVPETIAAAVRFSGGGSEAAFLEHHRQLLTAVAAAGLATVGPPRFARFDPPFKPWFLRHNEVVQDVQQVSSTETDGT